MSIDSGVAAVTGGLLSGGSSLIGGSMTNSAAAESTQDVENWETQMSDTAYQRQQADMKAAGLNPILAANAGGASTPSITAAPVINAIGDAGTNAASGFTNTLSAMNNSENTSSNVALNSAQAAKATADAASTLADLPMQQLKGSGARAVMPLVNSAVDAAQGATAKLSNALSTGTQSSATSGQHESTLDRLGRVLHSMSFDLGPSFSGAVSPANDDSSGIEVSGPPPALMQ